MKLTKEELQSLQQLNADFARFKMQIGELEVQKSLLMNEIKVIQAKFSNEENKLIEKYGADAIINIQTGEVTKKKE